MLNWTTEPGIRLAYDGYYQHPILGAQPFENAVANDIVRLNDGSYRLYFGSFHGTKTEPYNITRSAISSDLLNWTVEPGVRLDSTKFTQSTYSINAIFCRVLKMPSGYRLYFAGYSATQIPEASGVLGNFFLHSAVSSDGLNFTVEPGVRTFPQPAPYYSYRAYPSNVVQTPDGKYRIYMNSPFGGGGVAWFNIVSIISTDGLNWVNEPGSRWLWNGAYGTSDPVYPEDRIYAVPLAGGGVRLFIGTINNTAEKRHWMFSLLSADGLSFVAEPGNRMYYEPSSSASDPIVVKIDGGYRMLFSRLGNSYPYRRGGIYSAVAYE